MNPVVSPPVASMGASPRRGKAPPRIIGASPAAQKLEFEIARAAQFDSCVFLSGETGSGKESVARALHAAGPRSDKPFVAINCAALTTTLAESQLFGHVKGAFTGAVGTALGVFRAGNGGVVFLDEVGELPLDVQPKLLRVIQQREVTPVGSTDVFPFDVQIITATNRDLEAEVERGRFRDDLLYRLNTIELHVPALRDRAADIPVFVRHFSESLAVRLGRPAWLPESATLERMMRFRWPGNVRQLAQFVERVYVFGAVPDLPDDPATVPSRPTAGVAEPHRGDAEAGEPALPVFNLDELRRMAVRQALAATDGHKGRAAALLGVHLNTMTKFVAETCTDDLPVRNVGRPRRPR
ncbi:MAG: sigma-54 dependent transcriptional regulator [Planctomycetia bacterium]